MFGRRNRLPLYALRAFEAAARHRNLVRAADELAVTHSAVSHQVKSLEALLGVQLFDRKRRPLELTVAGDQLLAAVSEGFDGMARAARSIASGELEGEIALSCVPGLAANWLVPALGEFLAFHPNVSVHVETEYWRHPDVADRVDIAIAFGSAEHPGRRVVRLGHSEFYPVASRLLIGQRTERLDPEEIARYTLLHEYSSETWSRWFASVSAPFPSNSRSVTYDGAHLSLQAARAGYGIALGDTPTVRSDLVEGGLVRLSTVAVPAAYPYYLIISPQTSKHPAASALESWLVSSFAAAAAEA